MVRAKINELMRLVGRQRSMVLRLIATAISTLAISLVLVSGPYLQSAFVSFVYGDAPSLYGGIYELGSGTFPSADVFIKTAFWAPYLACAASIATALFWLNSKRLFLLGISVIMFVGLTVIDASTVDGVTFHDMTVSAACNALGGFAFALISFVIVSNASCVRLVANGNKATERVLWIFWPAACYLALTSVLFFVLAFLIKIPSTPISFRVDPPMSGYFSSVDLQQCKQDQATSEVTCASTLPRESGDDFGLLDGFEPPKGSNVKWVGESKGMLARWEENNPAELKGEVRILQGCITKDQVTEALKRPPLEKLELGGSAIGVDDGLTDFDLFDPENVGNIKSQGRASWMSQFWIVPSGKIAAKLDVQKFFTNGFIRIEDGYRSFNYRIALYPLSADKKRRNLKSRRVTLRATHHQKAKHIDVEFDLSSVAPDAPIGCEDLEMKAGPNGYSAVATVPVVSVIISVLGRHKVPLSAIEKPDQLEVSGLNGWFSSDGYEKAALGQVFKSGKLTQLSVFGALRDVQIDDKSVATGSTSTVQLQGKLYARTDGSSLLVTGGADLMLLNDRRVTRTRWEELDTGVRVPLILGIPTLIYFFFNLLRSALRRKTRHIWYVPN